MQNQKSVNKNAPDHYVVMGNPIAHSKSPLIHTEFARQTHQHLQYDRSLVAIGHLPEALTRFHEAGGKGANITVPFKVDALHYVDSCSPRALQAGAVNTIKFDTEQGCFGDNTDGVGLLRDLRINLQWPLDGRKILLLGAGGAARGILAALLEQQPALLMIGNRTLATAQALVKEFSALGNIQASEYAELQGTFDLIINATSASLAGVILPISPALIKPDTYCYDLAYGKGLTAFLQWAQQHGCERYADGLGMLVEQAAESFYVWRGVRPETQSVLQMLRASL